MEAVRGAIHVGMHICTTNTLPSFVTSAATAVQPELSLCISGAGREDRFGIARNRSQERCGSPLRISSSVRRNAFFSAAGYSLRWYASSDVSFLCTCSPAYFAAVAPSGADSLGQGHDKLRWITYRRGHRIQQRTCSSRSDLRRDSRQSCAHLPWVR